MNPVLASHRAYADLWITINHETNFLKKLFSVPQKKIWNETAQRMGKCTKNNKICFGVQEITA